MAGWRARAGICDPSVGTALEKDGCVTRWRGRIEPVHPARDGDCQTCALLRVAVELGPAQLRRPYPDQPQCECLERADAPCGRSTKADADAPQNLSYDPAKNEANARDPHIIHKGSLRCLNDMLSRVGQRFMRNSVG